MSPEPLISPIDRAARRSESGFGLIEVLVTLVILAVGLLSVAALQANALRTTVESGSRGMAVRLANDMADRLRTELPPAVADYITGAATDQRGTTSSTCYTGNGCTGTVRANAAVAEWQRLLDGRLPGGEGILCRDASPDDGTSRAAAACSGGANDPVVVKVWWRGRAQEGQAANFGELRLRYVTVVMP